MAWTLNPTCVIMRDVRLMKKMMQDRQFGVCPSHKYFHRGQMPPNQMTTLYDVESSGHKWGLSMKEGVVYSPDCGLSAINLADVFGADPIYLIGFDMKGQGGKTANWHDFYPDWHHSKVYKNRFCVAHARYAPNVRSRVINLTPDSELDCYDKGRIEDVV